MSLEDILMGVARSAMTTTLYQHAMDRDSRVGEFLITRDYEEGIPRRLEWEYDILGKLLWGDAEMPFRMSVQLDERTYRDGGTVNPHVEFVVGRGEGGASLVPLYDSQDGELVPGAFQLLRERVGIAIGKALSDLEEKRGERG